MPVPCDLSIGDIWKKDNKIIADGLILCPIHVTPKPSLNWLIIKNSTQLSDGELSHLKKGSGYMGDGPEVTYKIGNATVRIHGKIDPDKLKAATVEFLKSVERQKKSKEKEAMEKGA